MERGLMPDNDSMDSSEPNDLRESSPGKAAWPRPMFETLVWRAIRLRCPRCGQGKLFRGLIKMNANCSHCQFQFERPAGFYLGSMYINYGLTAWITTASFIIGRFWFGIPGSTLVWPLSAFCLIFPTFFFRYARALWLVLDCQFDRSVLNETSDQKDDVE